MSWTDERVALLEKLWGEGRTAAEIAKALGDVTRNAVIGKAHRLKLSNRVSPIQQNDRKPIVAANAPVPVPVPVPEKPAMEKPVRQIAAKGKIKGVRMAELRDRMCRWPLGDPKDPSFRFCGCASAPGLPYCGEHAKVAYQAAGRNRTLQAEDFEDNRTAESDEDMKEAVGA